MNVSRLAIVALFTSMVGMAATAQEATPMPAPETSAPLTRAEVRAELARARASGEYDRITAEAWQAGPVGASTAFGGLTRAQVRAELKCAQDSGEYRRLQSEASTGPVGDTGLHASCMMRETIKARPRLLQPDEFLPTIR